MPVQKKSPLRQTDNARGGLNRLWRAFFNPERQNAMKRLLAIILLAVPFAAGLAQPQVALMRYYDVGLNNTDDQFNDIYRTEDGDFYVSGVSGGRYWLQRLDEAGRTRWQYQGDGVILFSVIEADNGDAVCAGAGAGQLNTFAALRVTAEGN